MKKSAITMLSLVAVASLLVAMTGLATAAAASAASKDENKLSAEITMINADAKLPQAEQVMKKQLKDSFSVGSDKISSLLGKNMQYGDIAAILAFADKMPGGITDANINQVLNMRQSNAGWDQVAKKVNVDTASVAGKISSFEESAHKNIKQALAESPSAGTGAGGMGEAGGGISEGMPGGATGGTGTSGGMGGGTDSGTYGGAGGSDSDTSGGMSGGSSGGSGGGNY